MIPQTTHSRLGVAWLTPGWGATNADERGGWMNQHSAVSLALGACLLATSCGQAPKADGPPKYLVAGQSNSVSPANGANPIYSQTGLVTINNYYHDRTTLRVPTESDPNDSGYTWIYLGDMLGKKVTFNLVGNGGTSTRQWVDHLYLNIIHALEADQYSAILWVQGENDAALHISEEESYQNLKLVIEESRRVQPGIPWYVALDRMRGAQQRLIDEGVVFRGADLDTLRADPANFEPSLGELAGPGFEKYAAEWKEIL